MDIFNGYVKLPEGKTSIITRNIQKRIILSLWIVNENDLVNHVYVMW